MGNNRLRFPCWIFLLIPLYLFNSGIFRAVGYASIVTVFLITLLGLAINAGKIKITKTWIFFFAILSYNMMVLLRNISYGGLYEFILESALLLFITALSSITFGDKSLKSLVRVGKTLLLVALIPAIGVMATRNINHFYATYSPVLYKVMFPCTFFFLLNKKYMLLKAGFFSLVFLLITERTLSVVMIIVYIMYHFIGRIYTKKLFYKSIVWVILIGTIVLTILYVQLPSTELGNSLDQLCVRYTGGRLFSGRNKIWEVVYEYFKEAKYFGYGFNNNILNSVGIVASAHNTYLHILMQGGIVGLLLFYFFISSLWNRYQNNLNHHLVRLSASYLTGALIYINFEVTLIGNTVGPGIFIWLVIGLGFISADSPQQIVNHGG